MYCTEHVMLKHVMLSVMTSKSVGGMVVHNKQESSGFKPFCVAFVFPLCFIHSVRRKSTLQGWLWVWLLLVVSALVLATTCPGSALPLCGLRSSPTLTLYSCGSQSLAYHLVVCHSGAQKDVGAFLLNCNSFSCSYHRWMNLINTDKYRECKEM